jgi:hypothetical protein
MKWFVLAYKTPSRIISILISVFLNLIISTISYADDPTPNKENLLGKRLLKEHFTVVSQHYDVYYDVKNGWHPGIDYRAAFRTAVYSPVNGVVKSIDLSEKGMGRLSIYIDTNDTYFIFLHLLEVAKDIRPGIPVKIGDIIGRTGKTGTLTPHLHVELRKGHSSPSLYFPDKDHTGYNINPVEIINLEDGDSNQNLTAIKLQKNNDRFNNLYNRIIGKWSGTYSYNDLSRRGIVGKFVILFTGDEDNRVKGVVEESWTPGFPLGYQTLISDIDTLLTEEVGNGEVKISFIKRYRYDGHVVNYNGILKRDGSMVGRWNIGLYDGLWNAVR